MQDGCAEGVQCLTDEKDDECIQESGHDTNLSQGKTACILKGEDLVDSAHCCGEEGMRGGMD